MDERKDGSDARDFALARARELGLHGRKPEWIHNLGPAFERRMRKAYAAGKAEKIQLALVAMKGRQR
jgi:hypothetical protein